MKQKECMKCGEIKPLSAFYKHPKMADGTVNKCKECNKKDVRENRAAKIDYYREYDINRMHSDDRVRSRVKYASTPSGLRSGLAAKKRWSESNTLKKAASIQVCNAVRDGRIIKPKTCSICNKSGRIHGHHDDYAFPLSVRWLCAKCHAAWHKLNGSGANG